MSERARLNEIHETLLDMRMSASPEVAVQYAAILADALLPLIDEIRRETAERIRTKIEAERTSVHQIGAWHDGCRAGLATAAALASQVGGQQ